MCIYHAASVVLSLSGIKLGDVGPALGYKGVNNGSLQLTNVAIPREHLLMRYAQVLP